MKFSFIAWVLVIILLLTNIYSLFFFSAKIERIEDGLALETIQSVLETTENSNTIFKFTKYQYEQGIVDSKAYSTSLQNIINLHDKLITILERKSKTENITYIANQTIEMIKIKKEAYSDLKSSIDLNSENFVTTANNKFNEADNLKEIIYASISDYVKK